MKRVLVTAAIAAMLLSPLAAAGQDHGGGWGRGGNRGERGEGRGGDHGDRGEGRGGERGEGRGRYEGRGAPYGGGEGRSPYGGGRYERGGGPYGGGGYEPRYAEPRYAPPPMPPAASRSAPPGYSAAPSGRSWRRGDYLPPTYRGGVVRDPGRYRLRQAPPGYDWVGVGPNIYLMQRGTGMVLDMIPGGY